MSAANDFVLVERTGPVAWLTLNEPDRLNPINMKRIAQLQQEADRLAEDDGVKVVVVTGAGRAFSAGADLKNLEAFPDTMPPAAGSMSMRADGSWTLTSMPQPVIALVNGPAIGYGFELALQADIRVAAQSALFRAPYGLLGTVSDTGAASWLLPRLIGVARTAELLFTGRAISGAEAAEMGLVNTVVPDAEARAVTQAMAEEIAQATAWSLREMKQMLYASLEQNRDEHIMMQYKTRNRQPSMVGNEYLKKFQKPT